MMVTRSFDAGLGLGCLHLYGALGVSMDRHPQALEAAASVWLLRRLDVEDTHDFQIRTDVVPSR